MTPIRTSLNRAPKEPLSWEAMERMRLECWRRGILVVRLADIADPWERQFLENIGRRIYGAS